MNALRLVCWLVVTLLELAGAAAARPADPSLLRVNRLLLESRIEEADAALRPIESSRASDPSVLLLRGEILFQLGSGGAERRTGDA